MSDRSPRDIVTDELESVGIDYTVEIGKHVKIKFYIDGHKFMYVVSCTQSDKRTADNSRAGIRRLLRENGVALSPK